MANEDDVQIYGIDDEPPQTAPPDAEAAPAAAERAASAGRRARGKRPRGAAHSPNKQSGMNRGWDFEHDDDN
eukprot:2813135-Prymnesium_polylepis.1